jgi:hypothetical protein
MIPSLFTFTLLAALVLLLLGMPVLIAGARLEPVLKAFPRHRLTAIITMVIGGGWFLWKITQLGQSDFGDYKNLLLILFGATLIGSILYVQDFLAVRGVAIIVLLSANTGLKAAFGLYDIPSRLVLVSILYLFIVAAIYYGTMPFKMRDTVNWLYTAPVRVRALGSVFTAMGIALLISASLY